MLAKVLHLWVCVAVLHAQNPAPPGAGSSSDKKHKQLLGQGVAQFESGAYESAFGTLQSAHALARDHVETRHFLAAARCKLGAIAHREGDLERAARHYDAAALLWPKEAKILAGLGRIRFDQERYEDAETVLTSANEAAPEDVEVLCLLAAVAEKRDQHERAGAIYARAAELAPQRDELKKLAEKLARVATVESGFTTLEVGPFRIQYDRKDKTIGEALGFVQSTLRVAHADLQRDLGAAPKKPIGVQLYDEARYRSVRENPLAAAFFDGRLRVPVGKWPAGRDELCANLRHELAHAFLFALYPNLPRWIHEGYAQVIEKKSVDGARSRLRAASSWLTVAAFEGVFATTEDSELMRRGYDQALLVMTWLRKDQRRCSQLLIAFATAGTTSETAIQQVYGFSFAELVQRARRGT